MKYILKNNFESTMINTFLLLMAFLTFMLLEFDYCLGVKYCSENNIPLDFILPTSGVPFIFGMTLVLFIFEIIGIYYISKLLKKIPFINSFCGYWNCGG